jgi:hypothetical protein
MADLNNKLVLFYASNGSNIVSMIIGTLAISLSVARAMEHVQLLQPATRYP